MFYQGDFYNLQPADPWLRDLASIMASAVHLNLRSPETQSNFVCPKEGTIQSLNVPCHKSPLRK